MWMNSQGDGIGPTGTSISVGPSRRLNARLSAARSSCGLRARSASAPKLCAIAHEIGIGEVARDHPVAVLLLLDAPHIAECTVVEHHDGQRMRWRMAVASSFEVKRKPPSPRDRQHRHVARARAARRARSQTPSRDCPDSPATETSAACRPEAGAERQNRVWVTSSTKMPSSGSSARIASRKPICGASLSRRRRISACRACISSRREGARWPESASIRRRRIGAASPMRAAAGAREPFRLLGIGIDADDGEAPGRCPTA